MSKRMVFLGALSLLLMQSSSADMGRVTVHTQGVEVSESAQNAIILHNEREEVLILGTEMQANQKTPIVRFIPFPAEPQVSLAPKDVFEKLAGIVAKYKLAYVRIYHSKGPGGSVHSEGVEIRLSAKLGAHDLTVIKVNEVGAFRGWVNTYFRSKHLPVAKSYPKEEAVVADYVAHGISYFVLDAVELTKDAHFVDPVAYKFESKALYYPLKTSNTFGGKGEIDLFVVAPTTLCVPGSGDPYRDEGDLAVGSKGMAYGDCLGLAKVKASTSAQLVTEEHDLQAIYPDAAAFFDKMPVFIQSMHYQGEYHFDNDVLIPLPAGAAKAFAAPREEEMNQHNPFLHSEDFGEQPALCWMKADPGPCKGLFEKYYFDPLSKSCKSFDWGGCQGSVPFETLENCEKTCKTSQPLGN